MSNHIIVNKNKGVFLGICDKFAYFSDLDSVGLSTAICFKDLEAANRAAHKLNLKLGRQDISVEAVNTSVVDRAYCRKKGFVWK